MKKFMIAFMVLSLVLGGVALAAAADVPQVSKSLDLSKLQKISDQEAQQIKGTGNGFSLGGFGTCTNVCVPQATCVPKSNSYLWGSTTSTPPYKVGK